MKLLLILPTRERGGVEEHALKVASAAVQEWEVHASVPFTKGTESLVADLKRLGVVCHSLTIPEQHFRALKEEQQGKNTPLPQDEILLRGVHSLERGIRIFKEAGRVLTQCTRTLFLLTRIRPEVVLLPVAWPTFGMGLILACGWKKVPTGVVFHLYPFPFSFRRLKVMAYNWARKRNQQWIAVSEHNRRLICETFQIPSREVLRIYNGTKVGMPSSDSCLKDDEVIRKEVRSELGLPESSRLVLTVARLDLQKGHDDLIPALPHIAREFSDVRFVWAGEGERRRFLQERIREYHITESVLLLGHRSDVSRLMRASDLFVLPTRYEGHPFSILEAMHHGLPIVTTDASGIPEVIEAGTTGLMARVGDPCELLEAIRWALGHPEEMRTMAYRARLRTREFTEERMLNETLGVLRDIARIA